MTLNEAYEIYRSNPSEEAMEKLYPLVREKVKRTIRYQLHAEPDEDLVVTITSDSLMKLGNFKPELSGFGTWVEKFTHDAVVDELRKGPERNDEGLEPAFQRYAFDKALEPEVDFESSDKWTGRPGKVRDPNSTDFESAFSELLERAETILTDEEQELLRLKLEGYEGAEIAEKTGRPVGTIWRKFFEIREKLVKEKAA